ncbi:MAG: sulfotransferase domain-containing protein [Balneolaceae bacterium]
MKLPDFIIVGTMKSGTSTLGHYLRQHKNIFMPKDEVYFFDATGGYKDRWEKGIDWYREQFKDADENQIVGEKTPTYCYLVEVPERIYELLPEVKLIWIFRKPFDRAYSNYWHAVRNGGEKESFEYAEEDEQDRIKENIWNGYLQRSNYIKQVENYLKYFSLDQM